MKISIKTNRLKSNTISNFKEILSSLTDLKGEYVDEIIVCDENQFTDQAKQIDPNISLTNIYGSVMMGKTIFQDGKSKILLNSDIVASIGENIILNRKDDITTNESALRGLKTLFHEFGHAKVYFDNGKLITKPETDNYKEYVNAHWKILRDEYIAEMNCGNICKYTSTINWYGGFSDHVEEKNFREYAKQYSQSQDGLSWLLAFQILHQYYFIPLFQKAGFWEGSRNFVQVNDLTLCSTLKKILKFRVLENSEVPVDFNALLNEKWEEFHILELLST